MSWHTKYRPRAVADLHLVGVRNLLLQLMVSGRFPQVFLCAGPKGTGKTSTARIIGAMLNDPANELAVAEQFGQNREGSRSKTQLVEPNPTSDLSEAIFAGESFVVQELDAASNRGIDDVRILKERAVIPPQGARVTVYILDEVHMLTTEAFNALLKLLEEPPSHAVFVLATTELHKVPATIQSRCTILPFHKASTDELVAAITKVVQAEQLSIESDAVSALALHADGSFRDAVKALELVVATASGEEITNELVSLILNTGYLTQLPVLLDSVLQKDEQKVVAVMQDLRNLGVSAPVVHKAILSLLHHDLLQALGVFEGTAKFNQRVSHFLLQELQQISSSTLEPIPLLALELKFLELIFRSKDRATPSGSAPPTGSPKTSLTPVKTKKISSDVDSVEAVRTKLAAEYELASTATIASLANVEPVHHLDTQPLLSAWAEFVTAVEKRNSTLGAFLRSAKPLVEQSNGVAKVEVYYKFHRDQLMLPRFIDVLQQCAEPMLGGRPGFEFVLAAPQEAIAESALM